MSIQTHKKIFSNDSHTLQVNFSGIKDSIVTTDTLRVSFYAYDSTGKPKFAETLNFNEVKSLFEHLNQISIIRDSSITVSGRLIETTDEFANILNKIGSINADTLKAVLYKLEDEEKINALFVTLSEMEIDDLSALQKYQGWYTEINNLKKLLLLEENGNIVEEIKKEPGLKVYVAGQPEKIFQNWIERNHLWIFGVEYIKKYDARKIALFSEADLLMESMDGFLDLIELKRPSLKIFNFDQSHKSYYPSPELSAVIGQCLFYLEKMDNFKLVLENEYKVKILRPRIKIIGGRTANFDDGQYRALRMLNCNLNHIQIVSYDYLLSCGKKMIESLQINLSIQHLQLF